MVESDLRLPLKLKNRNSHPLRLALALPLSFYSLSAPQSVPTPSRAQSINGSSVEVAWDEPAVVKGVLEKYVLKAYSKGSSQPHTPSASTELNDTNTRSGKGHSLESLSQLPLFRFGITECFPRFTLPNTLDICVWPSGKQ